MAIPIAVQNCGLLELEIAFENKRKPMKQKTTILSIW